MINTKEKYNEYLKSVDDVCMECALMSEEKCTSCPVRTTVDQLEEHFNRNEKLVNKIATFFEKEENWIALKHCWIYSGRSEDLRKLLRQALQG